MKCSEAPPLERHRCSSQGDGACRYWEHDDISLLAGGFKLLQFQGSALTVQRGFPARTCVQNNAKAKESTGGELEGGFGKPHLSVTGFAQGSGSSNGLLFCRASEEGKKALPLSWPLETCLRSADG